MVVERERERERDKSYWAQENVSERELTKAIENSRSREVFVRECARYKGRQFCVCV